MDIIDALEDIKDQNARRAQVNMETLLADFRRLEQDRELQDRMKDEAEVRRLFGKRDTAGPPLPDSDSDDKRSPATSRGLKRRAEIHVCTDRLLTEAAPKADSTTAESRRVSSEVRLGNCTQVWGVGQI